MLKRMFFYSAVIVLVSWSAATSSHAGFSINLPGFGLSLPLPGAAINIGLPVVAAPVYPSYHQVARHDFRDYDRHDNHGRFDADRDSYHRDYGHDMARGYGHGSGKFEKNGHTGFYGGR
ncbi:MAG: hypothetical protein VB050_09130 [Geobacteraceae bacterium]|nr:hypothetical protein [Geobacteraceae bacterium]